LINYLFISAPSCSNEKRQIPYQKDEFRGENTSTCRFNFK